MGHKGPVQLRPRCIGVERPRTQTPIYLSKSYYEYIVRLVGFVYINKSSLRNIFQCSSVVQQSSKLFVIYTEL